MTKDHKNILFIVADDLGKYIGAYGCKSITTPNLDKFASEGVRFDLAFASTASCSGSRSTIYTGLHTHENGQYGLNQVATHFQTFEHVDTLPQLFNRADYLTGIVGKIHVGVKSTYPWTIFDDIETRDSAMFGDHCDAFFQKAIEADKPFNLCVGFHDPHRDQSRGGFANNHGPFDPRVKDIEVSPEDVQVPDWLTDVPELRQELVEYYRAIYRFDQGIGFILDNLAKRGLVESTLVIITSDNGPPFINSKTTLYDSGTCLPFMVRDPALVAKGVKGLVNPNMVSFLDILPTMLDYAGLPLNLKTKELSPDRLGRSILPILSRSDVVREGEWPHHVFCSHTYHERANYWPTRAIRTRKYKYHRNIAWRLDFPFATDLYSSLSFEGIRNLQTPVFLGSRSLRDYIFRPAEQLFDLENDPLEVNDLAKDPACAEILKDLQNRLETWQIKTEDLWFYKDGQSVKGLEVWLGTDEMMMPNRHDFDPDQPSLKAPGVKLMKVKGDPIGIRGATLYGGKGRQIK
ncbi:uncharacterized protein L199_006522 [Kwoniella botswanensis]|uniref:uncharacterized protein n=1 Tax=Kwoniella botswanensis TaxID=1268659 RepID=UPI00315CDA69